MTGDGRGTESSDEAHQLGKSQSKEGRSGDGLVMEVGAAEPVPGAALLGPTHQLRHGGQGGVPLRVPEPGQPALSWPALDLESILCEFEHRR